MALKRFTIEREIPKVCGFGAVFSSITFANLNSLSRIIARRQSIHIVLSLFGDLT